MYSRNTFRIHVHIVPYDQSNSITRFARIELSKAGRLCFIVFCMYAFIAFYSTPEHNEIRARNMTMATVRSL